MRDCKSDLSRPTVKEKERGKDFRGGDRLMGNLAGLEDRRYRRERGKHRDERTGTSSS